MLRQLQRTVVVGLFILGPWMALADDTADIVPLAGQPRPSLGELSPADATLLDEVQRGCFLYFWKEVGEPAQLAKDRKKAPVASVAAVGFQLASLPVGVEHGWITKDEGRQRAEVVLRRLIERTDNKHLGIYLHFPDHHTGGLSMVGYEILASTVDSALLFAGAIVAGEYFGNEVKSLADRMVAAADWKAYGTGPDGRLSMGWKPADPEDMAGAGEFHPAHWNMASDEERLIYVLAAGADESKAIDPRAYYTLNRVIKSHKDGQPYAVSYNGTLFTYFFSHCYIDFRGFGPDDPSRFGVDAPRVDWFENSRRAVLTHRQRCIEVADQYPTLAADRWGLSACAGPNGYIVPQVQPNLSGKDEWHDGVVTPYAAASSIMFAPAEALAAVRAFRALKDESGEPLVWRDPDKGGYGFVDAFSLSPEWASDDYVGIDQGPMLLAIENARTGLIWKLFMQNETVKRGLGCLRLTDLK